MRKHKIVMGTPASAGAPHGYGIITRGIREALKRHAAESVEMLPPLTTEYGWDWRLVISQVAPWFIGDGRHDDIIWHTMLEIEPFPDFWGRVLNRVRAVWAPSEWVREQLRYVGVRRPILVAPYGVDHDVFTPVDRSGRDGPFTVLTWGRGLVSRKHLLDAVMAFAKAGLDDARLVVKVNADDETVKNGAAFTYNGRPIDGVEVINRNLPRRAMARLLHEADVLLYLSGGEGLGLMPLEAMATALPVVMMAVTGMGEYADTDTVYVVGGRREPARTYINRFGYHCTWWRPDVDEVADVLRHIYHHRDEAIAKGWAGHQRSLLFTWERMASEFVGFLDTLEV